jgi:hypothetical protein
MHARTHARAQVLPAMDAVIAEVSRLAAEHADAPMLSRTHGQTASPTTVGKEMAVFAYRLAKQREAAAGVNMLGKMAGEGVLGVFGGRWGRSGCAAAAPSAWRPRPHPFCPPCPPPRPPP